MYCSNCGAKLEEGADVCVKCGVILDDVNINTRTRNQNTVKVKGVLSMIFGILGFLAVSGAFFEACDGVYENTVLDAVQSIYWPLVFSVAALILSLIDFKEKRNGFNITGIVLSLLSLCVGTITFMVVLLG